MILYRQGRKQTLQIPTESKKLPSGLTLEKWSLVPPKKSPAPYFFSPNIWNPPDFQIVTRVAGTLYVEPYVTTIPNNLWVEKDLNLRGCVTLTHLPKRWR